MARQYQLPGVGFINADEDGREYQIPGGGYFNDETVASGGATTIDLTAATFDWTANSVQPKDQKTLTTGTFTFSGQSIQNSLITRLGAAALTFTANAIAVGGQTIIDLTRATFTFTAQALEKIQDTLIDLTSAVFTFSAKPITVSGFTAAVRRGGGMMMMLARRLSGRRYRDKIGKHE